MPKLVAIGIDALFAALRDNEHKALVDLMVSLLRRNAYSLDEFLEGVHSKTDQLEDLRCAKGSLCLLSLSVYTLSVHKPSPMAQCRLSLCHIHHASL